MESRHLSETKE